MEPLCVNVTGIVDHDGNDTVYPLENPSSWEIYRLVAGCTSFLFVLPFVLFEFRKVPISSTGAVLVGAGLMVLLCVITQEEALKVLGAYENITTIFLLLGMMILASYYDREKLLHWLLDRVLPEQSSFSFTVLVISLLTFVISAIFTNDVCCTALTPIVLKFLKSRRQMNRLKVEIILLAIATNSNIGSVVTVFGNPQMALIASKTAAPGYQAVRLDILACFKYLLIPAVIVAILNFVALLAYFRLRIWNWTRHAAMPVAGSAVDQAVSETVESPKHVQAIETDESLEMTNVHDGLLSPPADVPMSDLGENMVARNGHSVSPIPADGRDTVQIVTSATSLHRLSGAADYGHAIDENFLPSNSRPFHVCLVVLLVMIIVLLLVKTDRIKFELGTVPMFVAILALFADTIINRRRPQAVLKHVDWNILLLFFGFFVWMRGVNSTGVPGWAWHRLKLDRKHSDVNFTAKELTLFSMFIAIGSNIFSNVPLTIIILDRLEPCTSPAYGLTLVLCLAWVLTLAGNLTLFGSVANLIVAQMALEEGHRFSFFDHLRFSFLVTIVTTTVGMLIIIGLQHAWTTY